MNNPLVQLNCVSYRNIIHDATLDIHPGDRLGIIGPSGSGKTTLMRLMMGALTPTTGTVRTRGRFSYIPQDIDASLNPHLSVRDVIIEPARINRIEPPSVDSLLRTLDLDPALADRSPRELSGGQRQRVAIARTLITNPDIIYADEALSALDAHTKHLALDTFTNTTLVLVTHDLSAINTLCNRWIVMDQGHIAQQSTGPLTDDAAAAELIHAARTLGEFP